MHAGSGAQVQRKISGPLLDRIDIQIEVPAVPTENLARTNGGETSAAIRKRVVEARKKMLARQRKENARLTAREIENAVCPTRKASRC